MDAKGCSVRTSVFVCWRGRFSDCGAIVVYLLYFTMIATDFFGFGHLDEPRDGMRPCLVSL